jgi:hypothetical protein
LTAIAGSLAILLWTQTAGVLVTGVVKGEDNLAPLEGVSVVLVDVGIEAITDEMGQYTLRDVPPGWQRLRFSRLGYRTRELGYRVSDGGPGGLDVSLVVDPILLEPLEVEVWNRAGLSPRSGSELLGDLGSYSASVAYLRDDPLLRSSDVLEAVTSLPAVEAPPGIIGAFHLRGGSADQNLVLLDGVPLLNPYHALGLASSINPDLVGKIEFHTGVPPARFGGRLSGILDLQSRGPDPESVHARGGLENYAGRISVDGPLPGRLGGFLVGARHSFEGPLALSSEDGISETGFHDVFGRWVVPLGSNRFEGMLLSSSDHLRFTARSLDNEPQQDVESAALNRLSWASESKSLRWAREGSRRIEAVLFETEARATSAWDPEGEDLDMDNSASLTGLHMMVDERWGAVELSWGGSVQRHRVIYETAAAGRSRVRVSDTWNRLAAFAHGRRQVGERVGLSLGLRLTDGGGLDPGLEPRASAVVRLADGVSVGVGYARMRQEIQSLRNEESFLGLAAGIDLLAASAAGVGRTATSDQVLASVTASVTPHLEASAEAYHRRLWGLALVAPETPEPFADVAYRTGSGSASGVGLELRGRWPRVVSRLAYGFAKVRRRSDGIDYAPGFHHDHWLRGGLAFHWTEGLSLRVAVETGSGTATSAQIGGWDFEPLDPVLGEGELSGTPRRTMERLNDLHSPWYLRFDGGARYSWRSRTPGGRGSLSAFATISNLLGRNNVIAFIQSPEGSLTPLPFGPLSVQAGLEWQY